MLELKETIKKQFAFSEEISKFAIPEISATKNYVATSKKLFGISNKKRLQTNHPVSMQN